MAEGAFSAEDLVRHAGAAIERLNPQLNAFVHTDIPAALARALDAERGRDACAVRCTASQLPSRTTSTPPTCPPPWAPRISWAIARRRTRVA